MNKTGLIAKISIKYVLLTCIWKYFWRISRDFAEIPEFRGSVTARNIRSPVFSLLEASDDKLWKNITNSAEGPLVDLLPPCKTRLLRNRGHS